MSALIRGQRASRASTSSVSEHREPGSLLAFPPFYILPRTGSESEPCVNGCSDPCLRGTGSFPFNCTTDIHLKAARGNGEGRGVAGVLPSSGMWASEHGLIASLGCQVWPPRTEARAAQHCSRPPRFPVHYFSQWVSFCSRTWFPLIYTQVLLNQNLPLFNSR